VEEAWVGCGMRCDDAAEFVPKISDFGSRRHFLAGTIKGRSETRTSSSVGISNSQFNLKDTGGINTTSILNRLGFLSSFKFAKHKSHV
jgi:hypothetical protein